jgi:hypothetical protein
MKVGGHLHAQAELSRGNSPTVPIDVSGEKRHLLSLSGLELQYLGRPTCSLVAIPAEIMGVVINAFGKKVLFRRHFLDLDPQPLVPW